MPVPISRRRANDKWDEGNMSILSCKIKKAEADAFREKVKVEGLTVNAVLTKFVREYQQKQEQK